MTSEFDPGCRARHDKAELLGYVLMHKQVAVKASIDEGKNGVFAA